MSESLNELIERTRALAISPAEAERQRRSFAYGNAKIENDRVTRAMVDEAADKMVNSRK